MKKACTYIRCSLGEERQQTSLKVQRTIISQFAENHGYTITKEFSDQESGRSIHRRGLIDCLQFAKTTGAKILIYRCDRLARTPQIWSLITDRLDSFRIVELGTDTEPDFFQTQIVLACAANESRLIGLRTKASIAYLKSLGRTFGNPNIASTATPAGLKVRKNNASSFNKKIQSLVHSLFPDNSGTYQAKANRLNELSIATRRGSTWTPSSIRRVLEYNCS